MKRPARLSILPALVLVAASALLSGCLFTTEPVFDETNSVAPADSPELLAWVEAAKARGAKIGRDEAGSAVPLGRDPDGPWPVVRVAVPKQGVVLVQDFRPGCSEVACVAYYRLRTQPDGTPEICFADTDKPDVMATLAERAGVDLEVLKANDDDKFDLPPDIGVVGVTETQRAFLVSALSEGPVNCFEPEVPPPSPAPPPIEVPTPEEP